MVRLGGLMCFSHTIRTTGNHREKEERGDIADSALCMLKGLGLDVYRFTLE